MGKSSRRGEAFQARGKLTRNPSRIVKELQTWFISNKQTVTNLTSSHLLEICCRFCNRVEDLATVRVNVSDT